MKKMGIILVIVAISVCLLFMRSNDTNQQPKKSEIVPTKKEEEVDQVEELPTEESIIGDQLAEMSLDEKIGQLIIAGLEGTEVTEQTRTLIDTYHIGGFIFFKPNLESPEQSRQLVNDLKALNADNDIPLFLAVDQEGGEVTRLPGLEQMKTNGEIGSSYEAGFSYDTGKLLAAQLHAFGMQVNFAPSVDVNSNPNNPVIGNRAFGSDPDVVSEHGVQMMKGMQDENIITSVKHFPGHGDTNEDSHETLPIIEKTQEELAEIELIPFEETIEAGADMVMIAHILLPKLDTSYPATLSKEVVTDLLREELEYDGVVVTDDMTMGAIVNDYGLDEASVMAVKAGIDIILMAHGDENVQKTFTALKDAVENGDITEKRIDESVQRILLLKNKYELADTPVESIDIERVNGEMKELYETY